MDANMAMFGVLPEMRARGVGLTLLCHHYELADPEASSSSGTAVQSFRPKLDFLQERQLAADCQVLVKQGILNFFCFSTKALMEPLVQQVRSLIVTSTMWEHRILQFVCSRKWHPIA